MPQPVLHLRIARRTLGRWRERPAASPFRLDAPRATEHFLHGALAPDMGLFPGGCRELSRLVHTLRSGTVIRAVRDVATDDAQRAFAWGWLTHALADAEIHPLVNDAADRLLAAEGVLQPDRHQHSRAHVRIELGLDAWHLGLDPGMRRLRVRRLFDARRIRFVADALHATYARPFPLPVLLRSHRAVARFFGPYIALATLIAGEMGTGRSRLLRLAHLRAAAAWALDPASQASGFVHPVAPQAELIEETEAALHRIDCDVDAHVEHGLRHLEDVDLETGRPAPAPARETTAAA